jgi:hypothetical protein
MANNFGRVNVSITASTGGLAAGLASAGKQLAGFQQAASDSTGTFSALNQVADDSGVIFTDVSGLFGTFASALIGMSKSAGIAALGVRVLTTAIRALLLPLGVIAAVVAPFRAIADAAGRLDDAGKSAERLGLSVGTFQTLSAVAEEVGVSVSSMSAMLTKMQLTMVAAANGTKSAVAAFSSLGLNLEELQGMSSAEQFNAISAAIMAIDNPAQRAAAAVAIFGRNAAAGMGFIKAGANGAIAEMTRLQQVFGVDITEVQRQGINGMNDALSRLSIPLEGFFNQLTAGIAPAITTMATLMLNFLEKNAEGWNIADGLAQAFTATMRYLSAAVTVIYGEFQLVWGLLATGQALLQQYLVAPMFRFLADWSGALGAFVSSLETGFRTVIQVLTIPIQELLGLLASALDKIGRSGLAEQLRGTARSMATLSERSSGAGDAIAGSGDWARGMADAAEQSAATLAAQAAKALDDGMENITNPFKAWDDTMTRVVEDAKKAAEEVEKGLKKGGEGIQQAVAASSKELQAIVVGTSEGESFRNMLARGGDARLSGDPAKDTAENTERAADGIDDLVALAEQNGFGLAAINV